MRTFIALTLVALAAPALANEGLTVTVNAVDQDGVGEAAGEVKVTESEHGLVFTPDLEGLPPGLHGFHVHQNASCEPQAKDGKTTPAGAAGGHYDPDETGKHGTPWGDGHLGDLPALFVDDDGKATQPVLAPRLDDAEDLDGRALMVHAGGDNHADHPEPSGGGGARIYCGTITQ